MLGVIFGARPMSMGGILWFIFGARRGRTGQVRGGRLQVQSADRRVPWLNLGLVGLEARRRRTGRVLSGRLPVHGAELRVSLLGVGLGAGPRTGVALSAWLPVEGVELQAPPLGHGLRPRLVQGHVRRDALGLGLGALRRGDLRLRLVHGHARRDALGLGLGDLRSLLHLQTRVLGRNLEIALGKVGRVLSTQLNVRGIDRWARDLGCRLARVRHAP
mmetsp:Transcript_73557/g.232275  ORF Transcript_73557/g.232275 Transcript_73557/m.232275 type:complete len:217 (-) Transcript_73557:527-1177(-)